MNYALVFKIISAAAAMAGDPRLARMRAKAQAVVTLFTPELPTKSDGTDWTQEDIDRLADEAREGFEAALERELARTSGPDGVR